MNSRLIKLGKVFQIFWFEYGRFIYIYPICFLWTYDNYPEHGHFYKIWLSTSGKLLLGKEG